jgi:hypothetical protein
VIRLHYFQGINQSCLFISDGSLERGLLRCAVATEDAESPAALRVSSERWIVATKFAHKWISWVLLTEFCLESYRTLTEARKTMVVDEKREIKRRFWK